MQAELLAALRARRAEIRARWAELLKVEPVNTPLAQPDALAHLIDWTLEEIYRGLLHATPRRRHGNVVPGHFRPDCPCGRNPLLAYFAIAEQALQEALILVQAGLPHLDPLERDAAMEELNLVLRHVARREIETFCGVCQHRMPAVHSGGPPLAPQLAVPLSAWP
jgi:hypothetical protein